MANAGEELRPGGSGARRFVYGGVSFDVLEGSNLATSELHFSTDAPSFASVVCDVRGTPRSVDRSRIDPRVKQIVARWAHDAATVEGRGVRVRLRRVGDRRYVASVLREVDNLSLHPLEETIAHTLVERCGGVILHAASIRLEDGRAVVFIGPSGAGKTTACALSGRPFFARDKVALVPREGVWWAWPLLGGTMPETGSMCGDPALEVAAVCRVRQSSGEARVDDLSAHRAVFLVRESCFANTSAGLDDTRLDAITQLCSEVPVGEVHTVLGSSSLAPIRSWLS